MNWFERAVFYQIYTLGFCGAPLGNDGVLQNRICKVSEWIPHFKKLGIDAIYFCPVFESNSHGYDTRDFRQIDCRLGSNKDFKEVVKNLHNNNIKVVLDGVFNHTGTNFWAFEDVKLHRENSQYKDWFYIDFSKQGGYGSPFYYEGWERHFELVRLNLKNPNLANYLLDLIKFWMNEFDIDGLRLDVAYALDEGFIKRLRNEIKPLKADFLLLGEAIHGDYNNLVNDEMLDSCTDYVCYKGLYSSFNDGNLFEIAYSLRRQFGAEGIYKEKQLLEFADNHDVSRLASILKNKSHIQLVYSLLFAIGGNPCIYYGSEWGAEGVRSEKDDKAVRPYFENPQENELTQYISKLIKIRKENETLINGSYNEIFVRNQQLIFERQSQANRHCGIDTQSPSGKFLICINSEPNEYSAEFNYPPFEAIDLLTNAHIDFKGSLKLLANSAMYLLIS
ncbi:MAG: maltodextrin glucosidase [Elusimicrobiota bacterium]|jgi:glycosidase|nr:maltodextrin glucosidase [Elusimicrobiota bacterium]